MDGDKVRKTAQAGCLRQTLMVRSAEVVSSVLSIMTEGLRLAGKEGFDGNKAEWMLCFTGCPVPENCACSVVLFFPVAYFPL